MQKAAGVWLLCFFLSALVGKYSPFLLHNRVEILSSNGLLYPPKGGVVGQDLSLPWNTGGRCVPTASVNVTGRCVPFVRKQNYTYIDDYQYLREQNIQYV